MHARQTILPGADPRWNDTDGLFSARAEDLRRERGAGNMLARHQDALLAFLLIA